MRNVAVETKKLAVHLRSSPALFSRREVEALEETLQQDPHRQTRNFAYGVLLCLVPRFPLGLRGPWALLPKGLTVLPLVNSRGRWVQRYGHSRLSDVARQRGTQSSDRRMRQESTPEAAEGVPVLPTPDYLGNISCTCSRICQFGA
jgi:hypothetical protein